MFCEWVSLCDPGDHQNKFRTTCQYKLIYYAFRTGLTEFFYQEEDYIDEDLELYDDDYLDEEYYY